MDEGGSDRKRIRTEQDATKDETGANAPSPSASFPNQHMYTLDPNGSGWWLHNDAPQWQYSPHQDVHYNAAERTFFRVDATTGAFVPTSNPFATSGGTGGAPVTTPSTQPDNGASKAQDTERVVIPHVADYTFMQGRRPTQEDRHTMLPHYGTKHLKGMLPASFYAVFDGHSGDQCSEFVSKNLHVFLAKELKQCKAPIAPADIKKCILAACSATDKEFLRIAKIRKRQDGCCCIAILIVANEMYVINVGDSRAVLGAADRSATALSEDHKPERTDEKQRIEKAGGQVIKYGPVYRVTTAAALAWEQAKIKRGPRPIQPAIARTFGDASLKLPKPILIATPEIRHVTIKSDDALVLLGCDGIWDVLSNQQAVDVAFKSMDAGEDPKAIAGSVVKLAYARGSTDNISVVAILFRQDATADTKSS
eukprot:m.64230 g.64230  ORF g.64230 m.64230 type:complete len:423 (+) comp8211_c0_seq1:292-1560(+)